MPHSIGIPAKLRSFLQPLFFDILLFRDLVSVYADTKRNSMKILLTTEHMFAIIFSDGKSIAFLIFNYPVKSFLWKINILSIENKAVLVIVVYIITVLVCSAADITLKKLNLKWVVGN